MGISTWQTKNLPKTTGVYLMKDKDDRVLYVGKARNLAERVSWYFRNNQLLEPKTKRLISQVARVSHIKTISEFDALLLEAALIKKYRPKYNVIWRDDKHPLYIKITTYAKFPQPVTVRREDERKATYFGPFPSSKIARQVLIILRRVFPYCTQKRFCRPCFYTHLGLCDPCPAQILRLPPKEAKEETRCYRLSVRRLTRVLAGQTNQVVTELGREMAWLAREEEYEQAVLVRDRIARLKYITQMSLPTIEYLTNPNLAVDIRKKEMKKLHQWLSGQKNSHPLAFNIPKEISRLECIDVSNLFGYFAVGSLVVFVDGEAQRDEYRRFRIRLVKKHDDPAMIAEVVKRRFGHHEWPYPQVLLVDGGKAQVGATLTVLKKLGIILAVAGLAKRLEELILPLATGGFVTKRLPANSPALNLLIRLRDEAHRFARTYHLALRRKLA